jgi:hypothetical protein
VATTCSRKQAMASKVLQLNKNAMVGSLDHSAPLVQLELLNMTLAMATANSAKTYPLMHIMIKLHRARQDAHSSVSKSLSRSKLTLSA